MDKQSGSPEGAWVQRFLLSNSFSSKRMFHRESA